MYSNSISRSHPTVDFPYGWAVGCRIAKRFVFERSVEPVHASSLDYNETFECEGIVAFN